MNEGVRKQANEVAHTMNSIAYPKIVIEISSAHPVQAELISPPISGFARIRVKKVWMPLTDSSVFAPSDNDRQSIISGYSERGAQNVTIENCNDTEHPHNIYVFMDAPQEWLVETEVRSE